MKTKLVIGFAIASTVLLLTFAVYGQELHVNHSLKDCSIELDPSLTQSQFRKFTGEGGMLGTFKLLASAEPLGAMRIQVGIDYSINRINDEDPAWNNTFSHPDETHYLGKVMEIPKLFARMGLSGKIDVGLYVTKNLNANYGFLGGDVKYAHFQEPGRPFASAVRASYVTLLGVDDLDFHMVGLDYSVSKNFGMLTPYVGLGGNLARAIETTSKVNLNNETVLTPRGIIGTQFSLSFFSLAAEVDISALSSFSIRTGFKF